MAVKKSSVSIGRKKIRVKVSRPGIHGKTKQSKNKHSKNYIKVSRGQG